MIDKYPFLKEYQVKPLSNNGFTNKMILVFVTTFPLFIVINGFLKIISGIIALISFLFIFSNIYIRLRNKWARIHYPVWVDYSGALGAVASRKNPSDPQPLQEDVENAFFILLRKLFRDVDESKLKLLLKDILSKREELADIGYLKNLFKKRNSDIGDEKISDIVNNLRNSIIDPQDMGTRNRINISLLIGTLIEAKYGVSEKDEYLYNIFVGRAK